MTWCNASLNGLGQTALNPVLSTLRYLGRYMDCMIPEPDGAEDHKRDTGGGPMKRPFKTRIKTLKIDGIDVGCARR